LDLRTESFKNGDQAFLIRLVQVSLGRDGPGNALKSPEFPAQPDADVFPICKLVRNKVRAVNEIGQQKGQHKPNGCRQLTGLVLHKVFRKLTADLLWAVVLQPFDASWVKGLQAVHALIAVKHFANSIGQRSMVSALRLQFHDKGALP